MFLDLLLNSFIVLIVSFFIAKSSRPKPFYGLSRESSSYDMTQYLFKGNSTGLATSSNIGSMLSVAMIFGCLMVCFIAYGLMSPLPVLFGLIIGYFLLKYILIKAYKQSSFS